MFSEGQKRGTGFFLLIRDFPTLTATLQHPPASHQFKIARERPLPIAQGVMSLIDILEDSANPEFLKHRAIDSSI